MSNEQTVCRVCGSRQTRAVARPDPWIYLRCDSCMILFVDPMPAGEAVDDADSFYDCAYYSAGVRVDEDKWIAAGEAAAHARMSELEKRIGGVGRILDVGCGTGTIIGIAKRRGWDAVGVEVSPSAAESARTRYGVQVEISPLQSAGFPAESFDVVWLQHVLEHVPDPIELLGEVRRILHPGGRLVVAVPNSDALLYRAYNAMHRVRGRLGRDKYSCSLSPPGHLYAFNARSLTTALARVGLNPEYMVTTGKGDPAHFPVVSWKGAGRWPLALAAAERLGRSVNHGSILFAYAKR